MGLYIHINLFNHTHQLHRMEVVQWKVGGFMANKNAATEDQIGRIHNLTTDIYLMKLEALHKEMQADPEGAQYMGDLKTIQAAGKWVEYNEVKSQLPTEQKDNPLKKKLATVKNFKMPVAPTLEKEA